jgi:hypothetical protein
MKAVVVALVILTGTFASSIDASRAAQEQCEISKAGIKRCETNISNAAKNIPNMKTIVWTDRAHDIVEWEINFPIKMDGVGLRDLLEGRCRSLLRNRPRKREANYLSVCSSTLAKEIPSLFPLKITNGLPQQQTGQ